MTNHYKFVFFSVCLTYFSAVAVLEILLSLILAVTGILNDVLPDNGPLLLWFFAFLLVFLLEAGK